MSTVSTVPQATVPQLSLVGLLAGAAVLSAAIATYAFVTVRTHSAHRRTVGLFALLMVGAAAWCTSDAIQVWHTDLQSKLFWLSVTNALTVIIPLSWILFALSYAGRDGLLTRRLYALLLIEPVAVVTLSVLALPPASHHLLWYDAEVIGSAIPILEREVGPAFYTHALYSYVLVVVGGYVLVSWAWKRESTYRGQAALLTVGAAVPLVSNVAHLLGVGPKLNLTSLAFALSGVLFWVAIARYRLLDIVPVARESVIEGMRDGYVVVDDANRVVDSNPATERLLSADVEIGSSVDDVLPVAEELLAPDSADERAEFVVGDGAEQRFVDASVSTVGDGAETRLVVLRDVTDIRETERRFQTLIENSSDMVAILAADGTVKYQSPSTRQVLGYDPESMVGDNAFEMVHPDDRADLVAEFTESVTSDDSVARAEYRIRHADGTWRYLESVGRNLLSDPLVQGIVINTRDVTDRIERERELAETNERLDRFASVVSHDLRNPLNVADGYAELLADHVEDETARTYVDEIATSHDRMDRIVDDVLALAREGDAVTETEPVEIDAVVRAAWASVDTTGTTLSVESSTVIEADRDRLTRVFENLFRNSAEHGSTKNQTESGVERTDDCVRVTVGVLPDEQGFFVADDGPGLEDDVRHSAFEAGVTSQASGTGLGLAIVADIVEAHDWSVSCVDSEEDGARFEFYTAR